MAGVLRSLRDRERDGAWHARPACSLTVRRSHDRLIGVCLPDTDGHARRVGWHAGLDGDDAGRRRGSGAVGRPASATRMLTLQPSRGSSMTRSPTSCAGRTSMANGADLGRACCAHPQSRAAGHRGDGDRGDRCRAMGSQGPVARRPARDAARCACEGGSAGLRQRRLHVVFGRAAPATARGSGSRPG